MSTFIAHFQNCNTNENSTNQNFADLLHGLSIVLSFYFHWNQLTSKTNFINRAILTTYSVHDGPIFITATGEVTYYHEGQLESIQYLYLSAICVKMNCSIIMTQGRPTINYSLSTQLLPIGRPGSPMLMITEVIIVENKSMRLRSKLWFSDSKSCSGVSQERKLQLGALNFSWVKKCLSVKEAFKPMPKQICL